MKSTNSRRKAGLASLLAFALQPAAAQTTASQSAVIDEIVVTGIRGSVQRALDQKRDAVGVLDAVSAEDIGKFPDQNVAEALQRVPGIAISRGRGEGNTVTIRGLGGGFARATLNGRDLISGASNRSFNFEVLASEYISSLEVFKTSRADMVEGGIGGVVNVQTARPLDFDGRRIASSLKGGYSDLTDEFDPVASALYSDQSDDGGFGWLIAGSWSQRTLREDQHQASGFIDRTYTRSNGQQLVNVATPTSVDFHHINTERERTGLTGALQWRPDDTTEILLDVLYTKLESQEEQASLFSQVRFQTSQVRVDTIEVNQNNTVTFFDANWQTRLMDRRFDDEDQALVLGLKATKTLGAWELLLDGSFSRGENDNVGGQAISEPVGRTTYDARSGGVLPSLTYAADINSDQHTFRNFFLFSSNAQTLDYALRLDASRALEFGMIDSVKFGVRYADRENQAESADLPYFPYGNVRAAWPAIGANQRAFPARDFFEGYAGAFPRAWTLPDYERFYALTNAGDQPLRDSLPGRYTIGEKITAGYVMANLDAMLGSLPMRGDIGVRIVRTAQTSDGYGVGGVTFNPNNGFAEPADLSPQSVDRSYTEVLPSLNLRFDLTDSLVARFAAAKVLTRPSFAELSPRMTLTGFTRTGASGNPELDPFTANQADLSLEWYFADAGALTGAVFYKDIDSFVSSQVASVSLPGDVPGGTFAVTRPENGEGAKVQGYEITYQQSFNFLPAPFDGFGVIANYTYADSSAEFKNQLSGRTFSLEGLAKDSYNIVGYYENNRFSARLAYNYRGDFLAQAISSEGNTLVTDDFGQLDASMSYSINDHFAVSLEGINLTESETLRYYDIKERTAFYSNTGRRYLAGVRMKF